MLSGVGSGLILFLAPEESSTYSGGSFVFYPSVGLFLAAVAALLAGLVGCWGATRDSKTALFVVRVWSASPTSCVLYSDPHLS